MLHTGNKFFPDYSPNFIDFFLNLITSSFQRDENISRDKKTGPLWRWIYCKLISSQPVYSIESRRYISYPNKPNSFQIAYALILPHPFGEKQVKSINTQGDGFLSHRPDIVGLRPVNY